MDSPLSQTEPKSKLPRTYLVVLAILLAALGGYLYRGFLQGLESAQDTKAFAEIYSQKIWGTNTQGEGHSGSGSTLKATYLYRPYLQAFLADHKIRSVVDAGCGDWEFAQKIDWTGIDYKGYDLVEAVIAKDKKNHAAPNIQFFVGNIVTDDLPSADLIICKHVLQHLSTKDVLKFLTKMSRYKHALLINGVDAETLSAPNLDIVAGEYRPLDLTRPPFSLPGRVELVYWDNYHMHQVLHLAQVEK